MPSEPQATPFTAAGPAAASARRYGHRPTMKDVAARAGVGLKTVSRVVNGEPGVTADTAERVQSAITALGFRRNDSARILRKGRTASVGLVLEDIADPFYSALSRAVEEVSRLHGSLLFTGSSDEDPEREEQLALAFCARRVDGLVIVPAAGADHRYLAPEIGAGIATVFVDRPPHGLDADAVVTANAAGAREGTAHLIRQGHRRIAFLGDSPDIHTAAERLRGYREAMEEAGLPVRDSWVSMGPTSPDRVGAALTTALAGPDGATALFCGNNRVTVAALRRLRTGERRIALVGFDDLEFADLLSPGLTVVAQDPVGMGRTAARLLFARLDGHTGPGRRVELPARLIVRGSGEIPPAA